MEHGRTRLGGLKCFCGREAIVKHPASGVPLCKKHFLRYLYKRVTRASASLGLLKRREVRLNNKYGPVETEIVANVLRRRGIEVSISEDGVPVMSIEKVLYFLLKSFYEVDSDALKLADPEETLNPAYVLLPYEVAVYAKLMGLKPPLEPFEGPLWEIAKAIALGQPTEAYSSLRIIKRLKSVFPVLEHVALFGHSHGEF